MKHLLDIHHLSESDVSRLLKSAEFFKKTSDIPKHNPLTLATLFYENSTRTRVSFTLAAKKLGMTVVDLDVQTSSEVKGEIIEDTMQTLIAMGVQSIVIRHPTDGLPELLAERFGDDAHIVNAGDGQHAHPSQALLDLMTIVEQKPALERLKIAIVGDLRHSRVANSLQQLCALMGVGELMLVAPEIWQPKNVYFGRLTTSLEEGLANADVIICLRVQKERLREGEQFDLARYRQQYALTSQSLAYARTDAMVMHPGPMNRGVEIDSDVADGPQSFIFQQVRNGVFMRMAILDDLG